MLATEVQAHWVGESDGASQWELVFADQVPDSLEVYGGPHPQNIDRERQLSLLSSAEPSSLRVQMAPGHRGGYFLLRSSKPQELLVGSQRVPLDGAPNFRDFGGYRTEDGGQVCWGRLFRSGHLAGLNDRDLQHLSALDLRLVCDFRRVDEQLRQPARLPDGAAGPKQVSLEITPGSAVSFFSRLKQKLRQDESDAAEMAEFMREINRELVAEHAHRYAEMFQLILQQPDGGVLINCTAGKDRTGFGAAMILFALGVPREAVLHDYLLSKRYIQLESLGDKLLKGYEKSFPADFDVELLRPMLEVRSDYLEAAFDGIDRRYGSVETYMRECLGLGPAELRQLRKRYVQRG